jgi:hypothetical protein
VDYDNINQRVTITGITRSSAHYIQKQTFIRDIPSAEHGRRSPVGLVPNNKKSTQI